MQVDDPSSSAFPSAGKRHARFAQAPASDEKVTLLRVFQQFVLEGPEILIFHAIGELAGENGSFDEGQRHAKRDTLYLIRVKSHSRSRPVTPARDGAAEVAGADVFHPDLHECDPEKRKDSERLDRKRFGPCQDEVALAKTPTQWKSCDRVACSGSIPDNGSTWST